MKYQTLLKVASGSHTGSFCSLQLHSSAGLSVTTIQRPCLCPKFVLSLPPQSYVARYEDKASLVFNVSTTSAPHICAHNYFRVCKSAGEACGSRQGKAPKRGCLRSRRGGRCLAGQRGRCRGLRGAARALPCLHRPARNGRGCAAQTGTTGPAVEDGDQPGGPQAGAAVTVPAEAPGGPQEPALLARPGREGGRR